MLPITETNNIKTKNFNQWLKGRATIESLGRKGNEKNSSSDILVEWPGSNDVVFKPGASLQCHPGNSHYRELLETHHDEYVESGINISKQGVITKIVDSIDQCNGRFLEWSTTTSTWVVMEDDGKIRTKVYNSLFRFDKQLQAKRNLQTAASSTFIFERQDHSKRQRLAGGEELGCCKKGCL